MLDLVQTFFDSQSSPVHFLELPEEILLVTISADSVVIFDARTLLFRRALVFGDVFPNSRDGHDVLTCISTDPGLRLLLASSGRKVAVWSLSEINQGSWIVHSSLILPNDSPVTAMDCKSGMLAIGTSRQVVVYTLSLENDLPTWSRKWSVRSSSSSLMRFSPTLTHLAACNDTGVTLYSTSFGRLVQHIRHPRPVTHISWRDTRSSSKDDLVLFTATSDGIYRIFMPVLDEPNCLQLHMTLDTALRQYPDAPSLEIGSRIFWLNTDLISDSMKLLVNGDPSFVTTDENSVTGLYSQTCDYFLHIGIDGTVSLRAVENIDRRPPTLLKQCRLISHIKSDFSSLPSFLQCLATSRPNTLSLVTSAPLKTHDLCLLELFSRKSLPIQTSCRTYDTPSNLRSKVARFIRTPEGRGVAVIKQDNIDSWVLHSRTKKLSYVDSWPTADLVAIVDKGARLVCYSRSQDTLTLFPSTPPLSVVVNKLQTLFCLPSQDAFTTIIGITLQSEIIQFQLSSMDVQPPTLQVQSISALPSSRRPNLILPVDPMAWSDAQSRTQREHDVLLSIGDGGELAFWIPDRSRPDGWLCTGKVLTGRSKPRIARCSSAKKTVLVVSTPEGEELTIWDSNQSDFASGLEYRQLFDTTNEINDLDWTSTPDRQSILAVGFSHHVVLMCQQRTTYFDENPSWAVCGRIDMDKFTSHPISDSIWLTSGSLLIGTGYHMFQFADPIQLRTEGKQEQRETLFEHVAHLNGPLEDYHPQMILQCLLWGKVNLVKDIILNLVLCFRDLLGGNPETRYVRLPVERFLEAESTTQQQPPSTERTQYSALFNAPIPVEEESDKPIFSRPLVEALIKQIGTLPFAHLTPSEHAHLAGLVQTTLEVDEQRRALDANGLRYLITMRSFYIMNERVTSIKSSVISRQLEPRERLRFRDVIWAYHSESQHLLLEASTTACGGKMMWTDAKALGVYIWLNSVETMKSQFEVIARNHYMAGDSRDPTACCLFYFALGKVKLVHGLWKQAAWHKEQAIMLKFLSNDFTDPRWRTAALKNAFALLSKQRFEYAAAFFILGGSLKDAVNVCVKQLNDFQLGVALARVVEQGDDGLVLKDLLNNTVVPMAFRKGNRWLASWAFWLLRRRDLAVRILVTPLKDISMSLDKPIEAIGDSNYDDPSLALLFSQMKSKTLQAVKGTNEISGETEFKFVLQTARVFCRMGCHVLALDLVKSWSFERPTMNIPIRSREPVADQVADLPEQSAIFTRRSGFALPLHIRRRSSIVIDMEVPSIPPTRQPSPERDQVSATQTEEKPPEALSTQKSGIGSLLKSAKQDTNVPEFDMNAFF